MRKLSDLKEYCSDKATLLKRAFMVLIWNAERQEKRLNGMERTIAKLEKKFAPRQPVKPRPKLKEDGTPKQYIKVGTTVDGSPIYDWR